MLTKQQIRFKLRQTLLLEGHNFVDNCDILEHKNKIFKSNFLKSKNINRYEGTNNLHNGEIKVTNSSNLFIN